MRSLSAFFALACTIAVAHAGDVKKELTPQQLLMKRCQEEATASGKNGSDRQTMVNTCLSDGKKRQQEKMKACSAENKGKKGEDYKRAQSQCLSKS